MSREVPPPVRVGLRHAIAAALALALVAILALAAHPSKARAQTQGAVLTRTPDADARVAEAAPTTNFGSSYLRVNGGNQPDEETFLRFTVSGVSGPVVSARLRLRVTNASVDGPEVHAAGTAWSESAVTWATRPSRETTVLDDAGALTSGTWMELDVTSQVTGDGTYGFALVPSSDDGANFDSREVVAKPELVVELSGTGPPAVSEPPAISGVAREGRVVSSSTGTWSGAQPMDFAYQWLRCSTASCAAIPLATDSRYTATGDDVGSTLRVAVTATNAEGSATATSEPTAEVTAAPSPGTPLLATAGDIAGCGFTQDELTAQILDAAGPTSVLTLGDTVYDHGTAAEFRNCFTPTWGRHLDIIRPAIGNHEYETLGGAPYFDYFGAAAGDRAKGYYAYDLGGWRVYVLNSNCSVVSCSAGSAQERWLRADLAANPRSCTLAALHHPRFSSASSSGLRTTSSIAPLYQAFYDFSGDLWLGSHAHFYERLAHLGPTGSIDGAGPRNFVVGTGGASLVGFGSARTGSQARNSTDHGVLMLRLESSGYGWEFVPIAGRRFTDTGSDTCSGGPPSDGTPPTAPSSLSAVAPSGGQVDLTWAASTDDVGVTGYDVLRDGTPIATVTTASFTDTAVTAGTSYTYAVRARDAAGNVSALSPTATVTPGAASTSRTFGPEADARISEAAPTTNSGTSSTLRVNGGSQPDEETYLRFTVSGVAGPVQSARLRVWVTNGTIDGPAVWSASDDWDETGITWANRPPRTGSPSGDTGAAPAGAWLELDVTPLVAGNGTRTLALATSSTDGMDFRSRESTTTAQRPELVVRWG